MRSFLPGICLFLLTSLGRAIAQDMPDDTISASGIIVKNTFSKSFEWGSSKKALLKSFGKAVITKTESVVLDGYDYLYHYDGLDVYFNDENNEAINITGSQFSLYLKGKRYRVGDKINVLEKNFPLSYKARGKIPYI